MNDIIELEVGGEKFKTARSTLTSVPGSLLAKMFDVESSRPPAKLQENGAYFIESDPTIFKVILHYLRHKSIMKITYVSMESIRTEAAYFGLSEMVELINQEMKPAGVSKVKQEVLDMILKYPMPTVRSLPGGSRDSVLQRSYTLDATGLKFNAIHPLGSRLWDSDEVVSASHYWDCYDKLLNDVRKKGATVISTESLQETARDGSNKYSIQFEIVFDDAI